MTTSFKSAAWNGFVRAADYVRRNPLFEAEERDGRLRVAEVLRDLIDAAGRGEPLLSRLDALFPCLSDPTASYPLTHPGQNRWLRDWALSDQESLRRGLHAFRDPDVGAEARFRRFMEAAEQAHAAELTKRPRPALTFGSLFNFALAPASLPVVRIEPFERLRQRLAYEPEATGSVSKQYADHVAFARRLEAELRADGVPAEDMLDVQALIFLSHRDDFWTAASQVDERQGKSGVGRRRSFERDKPYLSVCACLGHEAPYLREWLEFHRLVGVERFFLYNNQDREAQREILAPYVEDGIVVLHEWPAFPPQHSAFRHCLEINREHSQWIAFIDGDEFLFSPKGEPLPEVLVDYEQWPGVGVNWVRFGPSGHRTKPPGLVIENYVTRLNSRWNRDVKIIVDPMRAVDCASPHEFLYRDGLAVDENHYSIRGGTTTYPSHRRLRINHYFTKSEDEWRTKWTRGRAFAGGPRASFDFERMAALEAEVGKRDDAILQYLPALRQVLSDRPRAHEAVQNQATASEGAEGPTQRGR